jgi:hypothetical protein
MSADCPSLEILAAFVGHALSPGERETLEVHLVECARCRALIALAVKQEEPSEKFDS